jgi:predicted dehydrogenase
MRCRIALVGYGYWGRIVERYLASHPRFELVAVASPELGREGRYTPDAEAVITDASVDAVYVAVPLSSHADVVSSALRNGKHVLCEKPLAPSLAETSRLLRLAAERGLVLHTNYIYAHSPGVQKLRELLPTIGEVEFIELRMAQLGRFYPESVFSILGCHMLTVVDVLVGLTGLELSFSGLGTHGSGLCETGRIDFGRRGVQGSIFLSVRSVARERRVTVFGSSGGLVFDPSRPETVMARRFHRDGIDAVLGAEEFFPFDESNNLALVLDAFHDMVRGVRSPNVDLARALASILDGK